MPDKDLELSFDEYLEKKRIDPEKFSSNEPDEYKELKSLFSQVHPDSFLAQKLYLINPIRRKYPLSAEKVQKMAEKKKSSSSSGKAGAAKASGTKAASSTKSGGKVQPKTKAGNSSSSSQNKDQSASE